VNQAAPHQEPLDDATRQLLLRRMKRVATGLLLVASVIFVIAHILERRWPWVAFVRATAEAAMIGGLADWFAVTALFRHPLGIPIPHTAIVPRHKDRVGQILAGFLQRHFLSAEVVGEKLRSAHVAQKMAEWIVDPEHARTVARQAAVALSAGAKATQTETVQHMISTAVANKVEKTPVAPLLGKALELVIEDDRHQDLFDDAIRLMARAVSENRQFVRDRIDRETPWWVPEQIDEKLTEKIVKSINRTVQDVHNDPSHPIRERFDVALRSFIERLQTDPRAIERAEAIKRDFMNDEVMRDIGGAIWHDVNESLAKVAEREEGAGLDAITRALVAFGKAVQEDEELMAKVDKWVIDVASQLVERYRDEIGELVTDTVSKWDPEATSLRIELAVGRDLQFIRINGTLVGGLAGLLIYTLSRLF
jgi:uncharacterized membrane-anchored protein YjiN (DUF445 family)